MPRGVGVSAVKNKQKTNARYQEKAADIDEIKIQGFTEQLDSFARKLEDFATKHRDELKKNPKFRKDFQEMCSNIGVDPLLTSKGFWMEKLGVGDFYYEVAIQVIEICLATSDENGGLITLNEIRTKLLKTRSRTKKESITDDDIIRAVKKLKSLGHGFEIITSPDGHNFIQSVPGEMSKDDISILKLAEGNNGLVTEETIGNHLHWNKERIRQALNCLIKSGRIWTDSAEEPKGYWFPMLFQKD